jgi:hypothetical protein
MHHLEVNNFFKDPDTILNLSKKLNFYSVEEHPESSVVGKYAGKRTLQLHQIYPEFFENLCYGVVSQLIDFSKVESCDWKISSYFSSINYKDEVSNAQIIHQDIDVLYAGVVYLSKNLDINSGTSLYKKEDENYIKEYEFKNEFNKMIMYDASIPHGITKFVDNRLSLLFFIKELKYKLLNK